MTCETRTATLTALNSANELATGAKKWLSDAFDLVKEEDRTPATKYYLERLMNLHARIGVLAIEVKRLHNHIEDEE